MSEQYYVWVLSSGGTPLEGEGPLGPYSLQSAKTFARIGATEGAHDRAVSRGVDPAASSFEIIRVYDAGTGEHSVKDARYSDNGGGRVGVPYYLSWADTYTGGQRDVKPGRGEAGHTVAYFDSEDEAREFLQELPEMSWMPGTRRLAEKWGVKPQYYDNARRGRARGPSLPESIELSSHDEAELRKAANTKTRPKTSLYGPGETVNEVNKLLLSDQYGPSFAHESSVRRFHARVAPETQPGLYEAMRAVAGEVALPFVADVRVESFKTVPVPIEGLKLWLKWRGARAHGTSKGYLIVGEASRERPDLDGMMTQLENWYRSSYGMEPNEGEEYDDNPDSPIPALRNWRKGEHKIVDYRGQNPRYSYVLELSDFAYIVAPYRKGYSLMVTRQGENKYMHVQPSGDERQTAFVYVYPTQAVSAARKHHERYE